MALTLTCSASYLEEIKKSKFLTQAFPLSSVDDFPALLEKAKSEAASHHCWAWKFGCQYRFFDDGEPTGTAGKPILNAIEGRDCDRIAVIITRWFGGVELGTGGLARAYGGGASKCLMGAELVEIINWRLLSFHCPFSLIGMLEANLNQFQAIFESRLFDGVGSLMTIKLPEEQSGVFCRWLSDKSNGQVMPKIED